MGRQFGHVACLEGFFRSQVTKRKDVQEFCATLALWEGESRDRVTSVIGFFVSLPICSDEMHPKGRNYRRP